MPNPHTDTTHKDRDQDTTQPTHPAKANNSSNNMPPLKLPATLTFGPFPITGTQAFHISASRLSYALVNLRPLLPGHSLVCPVRRVARLSELSDRETTDLFLTVKRVSRMLERVYAADALNVAVQDGVAAGQSVNHVHVHVIPRRSGDVDDGKGDEIYERLDGQEGNLGRVWEEYFELQRRRARNVEAQRGGRREIQGGPDGDAKRVNREEEVMRKEAEWLRSEMERESEEEESAV